MSTNAKPTAKPYALRWSNYGPRGTLAITTSEHARGLPLSAIFFALNGDEREIEIRGMFTQHAQRRTGLASQLFSALLREFPNVRVIHTPSATPLGRLWLTRWGFTPPTDSFSRWELRMSKSVCNVKSES